MGIVYVLHFARRIGQPQTPEQRARHGLPPREGEYEPHAQHYIGYVDGDAKNDLERRIDRHRRGMSGAAIVRAFYEKGIPFDYAVLMENATREDERKFKNCKCGPKLCPYCNGDMIPSYDVLEAEGAPW